MNIPVVDLTIGSFTQLEQLIGIGLQKDKVEDIVKQFEWSEFEWSGLSNLSRIGSQTNIIQNQYCYLCYIW